MPLPIKSIKKIAVMGGTFDPIHIGHLVTAEAVRQEFEVDKVLFIPTGNPPHKASSNITSSEHRYLMCVLATSLNPYFSVSRIEIDREGVTYTIDTMKELKNVYGTDVELYFITGADAIQEILSWKNCDELLQICTFVAVTRPGYAKAELVKQIELLNEKYQSSIVFLEVPALAISSSDIRSRVEKGKSIKYLVNEQVESYIYKNNLYLYHLSFSDKAIYKMNEYVRARMSYKRYKHTCGVVAMALNLAKIYELDLDKVFIGALFHDVAKEMPAREKRAFCEEHHIALDTFEEQNIDLSHGKIGAYLLKEAWQVTDEDILNSIRYHTVGREDMSWIEKVIYLADMVEAGRKSYPGLEEIRKLALYDLNKAMYKALCISKDYVENTLGQPIHPITHILLKEYNQKII